MQVPKSEMKIKPDESMVNVSRQMRFGADETVKMEGARALQPVAFQRAESEVL